MPQEKGINPRTLAFNILYKVEKEKAYSNITINSMLKESGLGSLDSAFVSAIVYGVLEKKITLDYIIKQNSKLSLKKIESRTLIIIRMGLYQLLYMDRVPESAAVNESVKLAKKKGLVKSSGFINAVLRSFIRGEKRFSLPPEDRRSEYLSVKYSCPEALVKLWIDAYGEKVTLEMLSDIEGRPPVTVRVNTLKLTQDELLDVFEKEGVLAEPSSLDNSLNIRFSGSVEKLESYKKGYFHVQDGAAILCSLIAGPKKGDTVYDICSAPGGKAFTMAQLMENRGELFCFDMYPHKLRLIENGARRLGIDIITAEIRDGSKEDTKIQKQADVVLCDVPCSGTGIIRRKPEIRYKENVYDRELSGIQYRILCESAKLVKQGGRLVYSTCALDPKENGDQVKRFLMEHKDFKGKALELPEEINRTIDEEEYEVTLFPQTNGTDGFYIALLQKG